MSPRAPRRDFDPIRLVEAAYELHVDRATWLRGLIDALAPVLDDDCGIGAFEWSFDEQGALHAGEPVMVGCSAEVAAALGRAIAVMPPEEARAFFLSSRALLSLSDGVG
ncbi:MAG: hypothetical protein KC731_33945, partial [Myxococcales bacterium]|nr:hypothetical protein [Myxococcales bacterium]